MSTEKHAEEPPETKVSKSRSAIQIEPRDLRPLGCLHGASGAIISLASGWAAYTIYRESGIDPSSVVFGFVSLGSAVWGASMLRDGFRRI